MKAYLWLNSMKRKLSWLLAFLLLSASFLFLIQIPKVKAKTIEQVYSSVVGSGYNLRIEYLHPSGSPVYSAISQSFHVSKMCKPKNITTQLGDNNAATHDAFFQGRITTSIQSGSYYYPNETNILATTPYYNRSDFHGTAKLYNLTIQTDVTLTTDVRYCFYIYSVNGTWSATSGYRLYDYNGNTNPDANENVACWWSSSWSYLQPTDLYLIVYADTEFDKLTASNENSNNNENGISTDFSCFWVASGAVGCSGYIFSYGLSGSMQNDTWAAFSGSNNTWANVSKTLNFAASALGQSIYYEWFANASNGNWFVSALKSFTLQATVTVLFDEVMGTVQINDTSINSEDYFTYTDPTVLAFTAIVFSGYGWVSINWTNSQDSSTNNPCEFTVTNQTVITSIFMELGGGGEPYIIASFNFTVTNPVPDESVFFDGSMSSSSSSITEFSWNFGDGNTTAGAYETINHAFSSAAIYTVNLTVSSDAGSDSKFQDVTVATGGAAVDRTRPEDLAGFAIVILIFGIGGLIVLIVLLRRR